MMPSSNSQKKILTAHDIAKKQIQGRNIINNTVNWVNSISSTNDDRKLGSGHKRSKTLLNFYPSQADLTLTQAA